jgi:transposase
LHRSRKFDQSFSMVASISLDLRQRVVEAYKRGGLTYVQVAEQFSVGQASVSRWLRLERETGDVRRRPRGGGRQRLVGAEDEKVLEKLVLAHPDWTEDEYAKALSEALARPLKASTVGRAIRRLGYGVKKRPSLPTSAIVRDTSNGEESTPSTPATSPLRVWFLWTKLASTPR